MAGPLYGLEAHSPKPPLPAWAPEHELWYLVATTTGAKTISVTVTGATDDINAICPGTITPGAQGAASPPRGEVCLGRPASSRGELKGSARSSRLRITTLKV